MRIWPFRRRARDPRVEAATDVTVKWTLEAQKFKACPRHDARNPSYEPFDPHCPDCEITEPPVVVDADVVDQAAADEWIRQRRAP